MSHSSQSRLGVFDNMEEDELAGKLDFKLRSRLSNPNFDESPNLEHNILACVANESDFHAKGRAGVQHVEVDSNDVEEHYSVDVAMELLSNSLEGCSSRPLLSDDGLTDAAAELNCQTNQNICAHGSPIVDMDKIASRSPLRESPTNSGPVGSINSGPVPSIEDRSRSYPDVTADLCAGDHTFRSKNMEEAGSAVALPADYVFYRDNYYPTALVTISAYSIKIESLDMDEDETLVFERAIGEDVVSIQSQWYAGGSLVKVHIHLSANGMMQTENLQNASVCSGVEELKVMLMDPGWMLSLEKIFSLNLRYKAVWKNHAFSQIADGGDALPIEKTELSLGPYFPNFDEHFEDVIYPEGDADPVSIGKRDVDLLQPETFINDTIIDFYIKYLKSKIPTGELNRFHFFNGFFLRKLADLDKNPDSVFDGKAAFQRVRKWTRKLSLFEKDYIFIPVNYNHHWSLIVICHLGRVAGFADEKMNLPSRVPCILHMDSIRGSHSGLKNLIQSYLLEEWKVRQKEMSEDISSKFMNLRFLSLELPQQQNCYDCGLFLLHYVELFLEDAPDNFNPLNITKFSTFLTANWFIPADVSLKRTYIQRLIRGILAKRSEGVGGNSIGGDDDERQPFKLEEDNGNVNGIELISVSCSPQDTFTVGSVNSVPEQGFDINLPRRLPAKSSHCPSQPAAALRDLLEPCTSLGSHGKQCGRPRSTMLPAEEEGEDFGSPLCFKLNRTNLRPLDGLTHGGCKETVEEEDEDSESPLCFKLNRTNLRPLDGLTHEGCKETVEEEDEDFESPLCFKPNRTNLRPLDGLTHGGCNKTVEVEDEDSESPLCFKRNRTNLRPLDGLTHGGRKETVEEEDEDFESPLCFKPNRTNLRPLDGLTHGGRKETVEGDNEDSSPSAHAHNPGIGEHDQEDDSSPDSYHSSDDEEEVKAIEEDSESRDSLFAQDEKLDVTNCSFKEKFNTLGYIFTSTEIETPDGDPLQSSNGTHSISEQQDHISSAGEDADEEDDSSPDSDRNSSGDEVEVGDQDSESRDTLFAQNEKTDLPECSSLEKTNNAVAGCFASSSAPVEAMETPWGSLSNHRKGYNPGSHGGSRVTFSPVEENIEDINKSPLYSLLNQSSPRPLDRSTPEGCNSSDDDQLKMIKGDSDSRDNPSLNKKLGLQRLIISRAKRRIPDDPLSPKESEAKGDEWLIADEQSSDSDMLYPLKRPRLFDNTFSPVEQNIKDTNKAPLYSLLNQSSKVSKTPAKYRRHQQGCDSSDDDQVIKMIRGDSCAKRRPPDDLLSPKESKAKGDEWQIADDEQSSDSDKLYFAKRPKLFDNTKL